MNRGIPIPLIQPKPPITTKHGSVALGAFINSKEQFQSRLVYLDHAIEHPNIIKQCDPGRPKLVYKVIDISIHTVMSKYRIFPYATPF